MAKPSPNTVSIFMLVVAVASLVFGATRASPTDVAAISERVGVTEAKQELILASVLRIETNLAQALASSHEHK